MTNYTYIKDFHDSRKNKIGASEICYCIPHPVKQIESLLAYTDESGVRHANTALDLYNKKVNNEISQSGFQAEMGHILEPYILAEFISDNFNNKVAHEFLRGYLLHKLEQDEQSIKAGKKVFIDPLPYNTTPFRHNTEMSTDWGVAHIDCVFDPEHIGKKWSAMEIKNKDIDMKKPFNIQAKSANLFTVSVRKNDIYKGYDLKLKEWQGVPLSVFFQTQYEKLIYNVDTTYVALFFNTNNKNQWQIKANKKHQAELQQIAMYMKNCIDTKTPPKELLMNSKDIQALYPEIKDDFREIKDTELSDVMQTVIKYHEAKDQSKIWTQRENEYQEQISIHLKDTQTIKGNIGGMIIDIAKWKETGGGERIIGLSDIGKRDDSKKILSYLKKNNLIKKDKENRKPSIVIKKKELEGGNYDNMEKD